MSRVFWLILNANVFSCRVYSLVLIERFSHTDYVLYLCHLDHILLCLISKVQYVRVYSQLSNKTKSIDIG